MTGTQTLLLVLAVGVPLLAVASLLDRASRRRAEAELSAPPDRHIPGLDEPLTSAPAYVSVEDALAHQPHLTVLTPDQHQALEVQLEGALELRIGSPDARFATHTNPARTILRDALVLCILDAVGSIRELVTPLDRAQRAERPLVVVASHIDTDTLETLVADRLVLRRPGLALIAPVADIKAIAAAVGAQPSNQLDLQSGWLPAEVWGRAPVWVSDAHTTRIARHDASSDVTG